MHPAFYEKLAPMRQLRGQSVQHPSDQFFFAEIAQGNSIVSRQQPAQHAIAAGLLPGAFVIHATTPESVEQEIVAFDAPAPERLVEQETDAQVMGRMVVKSVMVAHGLSQLLAAPFDEREPIVGQYHDGEIELLRRLFSIPARPHAVTVVQALFNARDGAIEFDAGLDVLAQGRAEPF